MHGIVLYTIYGIGTIYARSSYHHHGAELLKIETPRLCRACVTTSVKHAAAAAAAQQREKRKPVNRSFDCELLYFYLTFSHASIISYIVGPYLFVGHVISASPESLQLCSIFAHIGFSKEKDVGPPFETISFGGNILQSSF